MSTEGIIDWVESSVLSGIDLEFKTTFSAEKDSNLQLKWLEQQHDEAISHLFVHHVANTQDIENAHVCLSVNSCAYMTDNQGTG